MSWRFFYDPHRRPHIHAGDAHRVCRDPCGDIGMTKKFVSEDVPRAEIDKTIYAVSSALGRIGRTDGGAFDPGRHPNLMLPERQFNCILHHILSVSDVPTWEYNKRRNPS